MILKYSLIVFFVQLIFIGCRTWNVKAISNGNIPQVLLSGTIIHITWCINIAIGADSTIQVLKNLDWAYIPVIICSLSGGLLGSYISMKANQKRKEGNTK